jgi:hypothetical protein
MNKKISIILFLILFLSFGVFVNAETIPNIPAPDPFVEPTITPSGQPFPWHVVVLSIQFIIFLGLSIYLSDIKSWLKIVGLGMVGFWFLPIIFALVCSAWSIVGIYSVGEKCFGNGFIIIAIIQLTVILLLQFILLFVVNWTSRKIRKNIK